MIFKLAHISFCGDTAAAAARLRQDGYRPALEVAGAVPMRISQSLLSQPAARMDLSVWEKPGCISIELLDFGRTSPHPGLIRPVGADSTPVQAFSLDSADLEASEVFWRSLGFTVRDRTPVLLTMDFRSRFTGESFQALLSRREDPAAPEDLDSPGFHLVGFISNSAAAQRERLSEAGTDCTPVERLELGGKSLDICYARSPEGVIAEFISLGGR